MHRGIACGSAPKATDLRPVVKWEGNHATAFPAPSFRRPLRGRAAIGPHGPVIRDSLTGSGRRDDDQEPGEAHRWGWLVALVRLRGGAIHARRHCPLDLVPADGAKNPAGKEHGL